MKVTILAVGRLRAGPEKTLLDDYITRFDRNARALGLGHLDLREVEPRRGSGQAAEEQALLAALPQDAMIIALDERGRQSTSPEFAGLLADLRDQGRRELVFVIGGADGLTKTVSARADRMLSFGTMVWPHMLVRVMLGEQLYRAASILAGSPYHRE